LSKLQKILAGIVAVCVVFFGFVVVRIGAAPNDNSVKLAKIPEDKQLGKEAYKDAYPLEYQSFHEEQ
jgi:nitrite reductase (cytochrome c-552)